MCQCGKIIITAVIDVAGTVFIIFAGWAYEGVHLVVRRAIRIPEGSFPFFPIACARAGPSSRPGLYRRLTIRTPGRRWMSEKGLKKSMDWRTWRGAPIIFFFSWVHHKQRICALLITRRALKHSDETKRHFFCGFDWSESPTVSVNIHGICQIGQNVSFLFKKLSPVLIKYVYIRKLIKGKLL